MLMILNFGMAMPPIRQFTALATALALAACTSSGGGPVGPNAAARVRAMPVTADMPKSGRATYRGATAQNISDGAGGTLKLTSNVQLDANFSTNQIDGTISNIRGQNSSGSATLDGSLTGSGNISGSSFYVPVDGVLSTNSGSFYTVADIDGQFKGTGAEAVQGGVTFYGEDRTELIAVRQ